MSDLISRQAAIDEVQRFLGYIDQDMIDRMKITIGKLPSAQPEIIRCRDCKHSEHWYRDRRRCFLWSEEGISVFNDGFCNYAERKQDDNHK